MMNSTTATVVFLLVAFSSGVFANLPGNCNRTFFVHGVSLCQRTAIESLAHNTDVTCDSAYQNQISCIDKHVKKCLEGSVYLKLSSVVVNLLKTIVFNCGTDSVSVNQLFFQMLNCKPGTEQKFKQARNCWNEFVTKYKPSKNDPTLCKSLADAKKCVGNITNKYCPGINLEPDSCNPFCANGTDTNRPCPKVSPITLTCQKDFYYKKERECEKTFIEAFVNKTRSSCSIEVPRLKSCIQRHYKEKCFNPSVDEALLQKLTNGILGVTKATRLFCNAMSVTDRPAILRDIIPCESGFYTEAETCAKKFREKFLNKSNDQNLCSVYAGAVSCVHKMQVKYCRFSPSVLQITNDTDNPFCVTQRHVLSSHVCGLPMCCTWFILIAIAMIYILPP